MAVAGGVLALALALRLAAIGVDGLWMDEVFGTSYANLGFVDVVLAVLRFDIHPPLYYLQLKLWSLPAAGDGWLLSNSALWSLATVALAALAVKSRAGARAGLVTLVLAAVLGSEIHFAAELRMYAMLSCLTVGAWWLAERWVAAPTRRAALALVGTLALLAAVHSAAFVPISCVLLYLLVGRWPVDGPRALLRCLGPALGTGLVLAPWLVNASLRSVSHTLAPDLSIMARTVSGWLLGYGAVPIGAVAVAATATLILALVLAGLASGPSKVRAVLLCFVVWPVALVALISLALRPIWLDRTLCFCAPFLAIAAGLWATDDRLRRLAPAALAGLLAAVVVGLAGLAWLQAGHARKMQYRELAQALTAANVEQLPIHVPSNLNFWGVARYLQGPHWGSLFEIQDPVAADDSKTWARIYQRIGEPRLRQLGLLPSTRTLATPTGTMWIGSTALPPAVLARDHWLVGDAALAGRADACAPAVTGEARRFRGLTLVRCGPVAVGDGAIVAATGS